MEGQIRRFHDEREEVHANVIGDVGGIGTKHICAVVVIKEAKCRVVRNKASDELGNESVVVSSGTGIGIAIANVTGFRAATGACHTIRNNDVCCIGHVWVEGLIHSCWYKFQVVVGVILKRLECGVGNG